MRHTLTIRLAAAIAAASLAGAVQAAEVAGGLPYNGSPDWSTVVFGGTSMTTDGTKSTLSTNPGVGVWFGYYPSAPPSWSLGSSTQGNYLSMDASFSAGALDWSAYIYDTSYLAGFGFAPTGCSSVDCYSKPALAGLEMYFADGADADTDADVLRIDLDLTQVHTYEFLLKNGQVSYRVDGVAYTGAAHGLSFSPYLVIGDGSATTPTGVGAMYVHGVSLDTAPTMDVLESTVTPVPEPGTWALLIGGFGLTGAMLRRRRSAPQAI